MENENKNYHTVETVLKSNRNIEEKGEIKSILQHVANIYITTDMPSRNRHFNKKWRV